MQHRHYRAVLFDFFGTLTQAVQRGRAHTKIARSLGCDPAAFIDVLDRTFYLRAQGRLGTAEATLRWVCAQLDVHPSDEQLRRACAARVDAVRTDTRLRPDAVNALWALRRRGVSTAVVSDCGHELPAFLPELPVYPLLDRTVFSVHVGECKPHPAMYLTACAELDVPPAQCLYVGDGGSGELSGAAEAGMTVLRMDPPDLAHHLVFQTDLRWHGPAVRSLLQVVTYLDQLESSVAALVPRPHGSHRQPILV
ncbi:MAG TPA: HAD-IA family hydrolase [Micromonosporaceae bacterium]|nr:HAD-IA family hydrolase [Micromonosporaceae bacterium]